MPDMLTGLADRLGDKPALIDDRPSGETIRWSYAALEANANRLANVFLEQGVEPGNRVMWCGRNSHWPVACGHAARKVGAVSVPLNYRLTGEEAAYVAHNSDAKIVFVDAEFAPLFERIRPAIPQVAQVSSTMARPAKASSMLPRCWIAPVPRRWRLTRTRRPPGR